MPWPCSQGHVRITPAYIAVGAEAALPRAKRALQALLEEPAEEEEVGAELDYSFADKMG